MKSQQNRPEPERQRRPFVLRLMFWVFMLWTILGWLRFTQALLGRFIIVEILSPMLFWYILTTGLIWGLAGLPILWGLARQAHWTPKFLWIAALVYPTLYWFERLVVWEDPYAHRNWLFMLLMTVLWCGMVVWAVQSKKVTQFFHKE